MPEFPKLIVFASGEKEGGGSGFEELVDNSRIGVLEADIVAVVSNYEFGGVREKADRLGVPFIHFTGPFTAERYQQITKEYGDPWVALSGWLKLARGLDPKKSINIHPGPLPDFGGNGMFSHHVHEAVIAAFKRREITETAVSMHFVTEPKSKEDYDKGPIFFQYPIRIRESDTPEKIAQRVNKIEHGWQSFVTNLVVSKQIRWDGADPESLFTPWWYTFAAR